MKRGFTIIELILVIGIIGILLGIVSSVAISTFRSSRKQQATALFRMLESGFATYYAQKGEWPFDTPETGDNNSDTFELTSENARKAVQKLVDQTKEGHPLIDVSGLWVSTYNVNVSKGSSYRVVMQGKARPGMDFVSAVRGTKQHPKKRSTSELYYGYPNPEDGRFLPLRIIYSIPADSVRVGGWSDELAP